MLNVNVLVVILREIIIPIAEAKRNAWTACYTEKDYSHSTDQCFVLKKQADKLKSSTRSSQEHNYSDLHTFIKSEIRKANKPKKRSKKVPSKDLHAFEQLSISDSSIIHDTESHVSLEDTYASSSDTEWNEGSDETIDNMLNNSVYSDFNNKHLINKRLNKKERKKDF